MALVHPSTVRTVKDLGTNKFFLWAQAVSKLAE